MDRLSALLVILACLLHLLVGSGLLLTNLPLCDEGFYGVPSHELAATGKLRNLTLESAGVPTLTGIDRVYYWAVPIGFVFQSLAFKLAGFSLFTQRGLSLLCGLITVVAWFFALRRLFPQRVAALAAVALSVDFVFCCLSCLGRADMMSLCLGVLGLAAYLNLRERSLPWALVAGHACTALSGLIHPNGGIAALLSLMIVMAYFDRRRLRLQHLAAMGIPYLVFGAGYAAFIAREPSLFMAQFIGNVRQRMSASRGLASFLTRELSRYPAAFGIDSLTGKRAVLALVPLSYVLSLLGWLIVQRPRPRHLNLLLMLLFGVALSLLLLEGSKQPWYVVHMTPALTAILAVWIAHLWNVRTWLASSVAAVQVLLLLLSLARFTHDIRNTNYQRLYAPTVGFLNSHLRSGDLVFGRSELYFGLNCKTCLRDDERLGAKSGRIADYIVMDSDYRLNIAALQFVERDTYHYIEELLSSHQYSPVFQNEAYEVLQRSPGDASLASAYATPF